MNKQTFYDSSKCQQLPNYSILETFLPSDNINLKININSVIQVLENYYFLVQKTQLTSQHASFMSLSVYIYIYISMHASKWLGEGGSITLQEAMKPN